MPDKGQCFWHSAHFHFENVLQLHFFRPFCWDSIAGIFGMMWRIRTRRKRRQIRVSDWNSAETITEHNVWPLHYVVCLLLVCGAGVMKQLYFEAAIICKWVANRSILCLQFCVWVNTFGSCLWDLGSTSSPHLSQVAVIERVLELEQQG